MPRKVGQVEPESYGKNTVQAAVILANDAADMNLEHIVAVFLRSGFQLRLELCTIWAEHTLLTACCGLPIIS